MAARKVKVSRPLSLLKTYPHTSSWQRRVGTLQRINNLESFSIMTSPMTTPCRGAGVYPAGWGEEEVHSGQVVSLIPIAISIYINTQINQCENQRESLWHSEQWEPVVCCARRCGITIRYKGGPCESNMVLDHLCQKGSAGLITTLRSNNTMTEKPQRRQSLS